MVSDADLSRSFFESLFEQSPEAVVIEGLDGRVQRVNAAFCRMFGYGREEVLGKNLNELVAPDCDESNNPWDCSSKAASGETVETESVRRKKDGTVFPVSVMGIPVYDDGEIVALYGIYRDISERREARAALEKERAHLENIIDSSPDGILLADRQNRILMVNPAFEKMFGYSRREVVGKPVEEVVAGPDAAVEVRANFDVLHQGLPLNLETVRYKKDGTPFNVWAQGVPIPTEDGSVESYAIYRDISKRVEAERALAREKSYFEELFNKSPDAILLEGEDGIVHRVNEVFCKMFRYAGPDEVVGKKIDEVVGGTEDKAREETLENLNKISQGLDVRDETYRFRADGSSIYVSSIGRMIDTPHGTREIYVTYHDLSDRKKAEDALEVERNYFENLFSKTPLGIALVQKNSKIVKVNAAFEKLFGYGQNECEGKNLDELICPGTTLNDARKLTLKAADVPVILERKRRRKDGRWIDCAIRGLPFTVSGEETAVFAMYEDITERVRVREALRASEKRYQQLFDESPVALSEQDISECRLFLDELRESGVTCMREHFANCEKDYRKAIGHIRLVSVNRAMTRLYEAKDASDLKGSLDRFLEDELPGHMIPVLEAVVGGGGSVYAETVNYTLKGRKIDVSLQIVIPAFIPGRPYRMIVSVEDITERRRSVEHIRFLGFHDGLTGLYNQAFLEEEMIRLDGSRDLPISLIVMDVNSLKMVNDVFGHTEGDLLLKKAAEVIRACCRREDIVARWGGDEFIALLPCTSGSTAAGICDRIRTRCEETAEFTFPLSLAMGVAVKENITQTLHEVRRKADEEMYLDKLLHGEKIKRALFDGLEKQMRVWPTRTKHIERLHGVAGAFASFVDLRPAEIKRLEKVVEFHDIGLVSIPMEVLKRRGPLSAQEWEMVRKHPERGFHIARNLPDIMEIADEILCHHERFDGSGYPRGIAGDEIPKLARFFAVVDAFEVMTGSRLYKPLLTREDALEEIVSCAGTQFDPRFAELFVRMMRTDLCPES